MRKKKLVKQKFSETEPNYDTCMNLLLEFDYLSYTSLLDPIKHEIYKSRANLRLKEGNASGCLEDLNVLLEQKLSVEERFDNLELKATACLQLKNNDDAREALGKALLLKPGNETAQSTLDGIGKNS